MWARMWGKKLLCDYDLLLRLTWKPAYIAVGLAVIKYVSALEAQLEASKRMSIHNTVNHFSLQNKAMSSP